MTISPDHIVVATLLINLYLSWKVYDLQVQLDKLKVFTLSTIQELAEAIDEIEEHLDDQED
tara:strand:- start:589 stop:771 length:183 start_codon:yes stop_codon:yes gene_type:complete